MTVPPSPSGSGMSFVPLDLVSIQVGRYSANVYPKIDATMPIFERAHAFQVARSAIKLIPVDTRVLFNALGTQLNCSAIVNGLMFDWRSRFDDHWGDFTHLTIQSLHNSAGTKINNTTIAGNPNIPLPVQNGAVVNLPQGRRPLCPRPLFAGLRLPLHDRQPWSDHASRELLRQTTPDNGGYGHGWWRRLQSHHLAW